MKPDKKQTGPSQDDLEKMLANSKHVEEELSSPKRAKANTIEKPKKSRHNRCVSYSEKRDKMVGIRVTESEREQLFKIAEEASLTLTELVLKKFRIKR